MSEQDSMLNQLNLSLLLVDTAFEAFLNEVNNLQSSRMQQMLGDFGSGESQVERLTSKVFSSALDVLLLTHGSDEKTIRNQYRKLSALVHPDKCKHPKANEAFHVLKKALDDLMDPNYQDKYKDILPEARQRVYQRRLAENPSRMKRGDDPWDLEGAEFDKAVLEECENMLKYETEELAYAERVRKSNEDRIEESRKQRIIERDADRKRHKQWERTREQRVAGWRSFQDNVEAGFIKTATVRTVNTHKDQESSGSTKATKDSYKNSWR